MLVDGGLAWVVVVFAVGWNAILIPFVLLFYVHPARRRWLVRHGAVAAGRVTRVNPWDRESGSTRLWYEFRLPGRPPVTARQGFHGPPEWLPDAGDPVTVLYDPARPRRSVAYEVVEYAATPPEAG